MYSKESEREGGGNASVLALIAAFGVHASSLRYRAELAVRKNDPALHPIRRIGERRADATAAAEGGEAVEGTTGP